MRYLTLFLLAALLFTCGPAPQDNIPADVPALSELPLIPLPADITDGDEVHYYPTYAGDISFSTDTTISDAQQYLAQLLPDVNLPLQYTLDDAYRDEAYRIDFEGGNIEIKAGARRGMLAAVKTLEQVLHFSDTGEEVIYLADGSIEDRPRYPYRGFMLDIARHFFPADTIKQVIDRIAAYKINHLHLHLSDDQGWRIEIEGWPKLTEIGAATEVDGTPGGFLTQADYLGLVEYAAHRGVTVVPEIDMPGHTNAALSAYPILNADGAQVEPYSGTKVGFSTFDVDQDSVYIFIEDVVSQLAAMTPGPYLHLGGDESQATEHEDYVRFIDRVQEIIKRNGKRPVGWDEVASATLEEGTVVQLWAHPENALRAQQNGNMVLMSPATRTYLDMQYDSTSRIGLNWAGYITLDTAYRWDPAEVVDGLSDSDILGIEAPLWSETVRTLEDIDYLMFPRLLAIAEVGWTPQERRVWKDFRRRAQVHSESVDY